MIKTPQFEFGLASPGTGVVRRLTEWGMRGLNPTVAPKSRPQRFRCSPLSPTSAVLDKPLTSLTWARAGDGVSRSEYYHRQADLCVRMALAAGLYEERVRLLDTANEYRDMASRAEARDSHDATQRSTARRDG